MENIVKNLPLLMNACYVGYNRGLDGGDFAPKGDITHCNRFISYVMNCFGYDKFNGLMANGIIDLMNDLTHGWITVSDSVAQNHANAGVIVIAGRKFDAHGHVCIVLPGILEKSGSFGRSVPKVVNIGKDVFFGKKVSFAFQSEEQPQYYALSTMI